MLSWQPNWKNNGLPWAELSHHTEPKLFKIPSILSKVLLASTLLHNPAFVQAPRTWTFRKSPAIRQSLFHGSYSILMLTVLTLPTQIFPSRTSQALCEFERLRNQQQMLHKRIDMKRTVTRSSPKMSCHNKNYIIETNPIFENLGLLSLTLKLWIN